MPDTPPDCPPPDQPTELQFLLTLEDIKQEALDNKIDRNQLLNIIAELKRLVPHFCQKYNTILETMICILPPEKKSQNVVFDKLNLLNRHQLNRVIEAKNEQQEELTPEKIKELIAHHLAEIAELLSKHRADWDREYMRIEREINGNLNPFTNSVYSSIQERLEVAIAIYLKLEKEYTLTSDGGFPSPL